MRTYFRLASLLLALCAGIHEADAQGTAFTYQGRLQNAGLPADGYYDLAFTLFNTNLAGTVVAGPVTNSAVNVTNGLFTTLVDFGPGMFTGTSNWLEVAVSTNGADSFFTLAPRQQVTPVPYALTTVGVVTGGVTSTMLAAGAVTGDKIAAGAISSSQINDGGAAAYQNFLNTAESVGAANTPDFAGLAPVVTTGGAAPAFSFTLNGSPFGSVVGFTGNEGISQPYAYFIEVQNTGIALNPDAQIGIAGSLTFTRNSRSTKFAGTITACSLSASNGASLLYTFRLESSLAVMARSTDYRVYQTKTAPVVASAVYLNVTGNTAVQSLSTTYTALDNLIQFGETDLNFFSRILEYEGIFYLFNQSSSPPVLILGDSPTAYLTAPNSPFAYYGNLSTNAPAGAEFVQTFQKAYHQSTLASIVSSYSYVTPTTLQSATNSGSEGTGTNFEFGTSSIQTAAYNQLIAKVRQDRQTAARAAFTGSGNAPDLRAGYTFTIIDTTGASLAGSYLVTSVQLAGFVRVTNGVSTLFFGSQFVAQPASLTWRPPLQTPKPQAQTCLAS